MKKKIINVICAILLLTSMTVHAGWLQNLFGSQQNNSSSTSATSYTPWLIAGGAASALAIAGLYYLKSTKSEPTISLSSGTYKVFLKTDGSFEYEEQWSKLYSLFNKNPRKKFKTIVLDNVLETHVEGPAIFISSDIEHCFELKANEKAIIKGNRWVVEPPSGGKHFWRRFAQDPIEKSTAKSKCR